MKGFILSRDKKTCSASTLDPNCDIQMVSNEHTCSECQLGSLFESDVCKE